MKVRSSHKFWVTAVLLVLVIATPGQVFAVADRVPSSSEQSTILTTINAEEEEPAAVVNTGALNVRSGPGIEFGRVTVIYKGQIVALMGRWATNNWVKVRLYSGVEGWVNSTYLDTSVPISDLPVLGGAPPVSPTQPDTQIVAVVTTGSANIRAGASVQHSVVVTANNGEQLVVIGRNAQATWVKVRNENGVEGWVRATLVQVNVNVATLPVVDAPPAGPTAIVTASAANVRSGPGGEYNVIAVLYQGQTVTLLGRNNNSNWLKIRMGNGIEGWIGASAVQTNVPIANLPIVETPPPPNSAVVNVSALNVRYGPGTGFGVFTVLRWGQNVSMIGRAPYSTWVQVRLPNGAVGWVNSNYLLGSVPISDLPVI